MKARLARSGHCAQVIGHLLLISGGILRDGDANVDIIVIDLNTMDFTRWVAALIEPVACISQRDEHGGLLCWLHLLHAYHSVVK